MSFFYKFMIGAALGGGATLYYQDEIERTTLRLQSDLHKLSDQLVRSAPSAAIQTDSAAQPVIPQRLPFSEELKARWNEQVGSALYAAQTTDWSSVASRTYSKMRSSLAGATDAAESAAGAAAAGGSALASGPRIESAGSRADEPSGSLTAVGKSSPPGANAVVKAEKAPVQDSGKRWV